MLDVVFLSRSAHSQIVTSKQCDIGNELNICLSRVVNDLLEKNVSEKIFEYDR